MIFFLTGILLTQLLYVLGNWQQHKSRDYLSYARYIVLFMLYILCVFPSEIISSWSNAQQIYPITDLVKRPLAFLLYLVYFQFMDVFLDLKSKQLSLHQNLIQSQRVIIAFILIEIFLLATGNAFTTWGNIIYFALSMLMFGISVLFILKAASLKIPAGQILLRGSICLATGTLITNIILWFKTNNQLTITITPDYSPFFTGIVLELFFFNLAIARKVVLQEEELANTQQKVITQLRKNEELVVERQDTRNKIARDLHDELGSTLSGVALFSELSLRSINRGQIEETAVFLQRITSECSTMTDKMNDIVWTSYAENDSMTKILNRLQAYAKPVCASRDIQLTFDVQQSLEHASFEPSTRNHLYLFSKEAINNAVKHANARQITYCASIENGYCNLQIKDDGIGFDTRLHYEGNGLKNMQARAIEMGLSFNVQSSPENGTCLTLQLSAQ